MILASCVVVEALRRGKSAAGRQASERTDPPNDRKESVAGGVCYRRPLRQARKRTAN